MRRPVKPFVTEYKSVPRRQTLPSGAHQPFLQENEPAPAKHADFVRLESNARPEDSYEAALRAADALFSGSRAPGEASVTRPAPRAEEIVAELPGAPHALAPERGGRILRVIDEPPPPALVALEEARAPKRRGRKPGSKNKPKALPIERAAVDVKPSVQPSVLALVGAANETPIVDTLLANVPAPPVWMTAATVNMSSRGRGNERFSWVRKTLGPGERWKRHMPKVCW